MHHSDGVARPRILVAGLGNVLRGDDGFGIAVVRRLQQRPDLPAGVRVTEVGIGGIALVQELLDGYGLLIVVDAVAGGAPPGTVTTLRAEAPDPAGLGAEEARALVGDPHTTTPARVFLLARALGVLPDEVYLVGCEPLECDEVRLGLTRPVARAVDEAADRVVALARDWLRRTAPTVAAPVDGATTPAAERVAADPEVDGGAPAPEGRA